MTSENMEGEKVIGTEAGDKTAEILLGSSFYLWGYVKVLCYLFIDAFFVRISVLNSYLTWSCLLFLCCTVLIFFPFHSPSQPSLPEFKLVYRLDPQTAI